MNETTLLTIAAALVGDERIGDEGSWQALRAVVGAKVDVTTAGIEQVARRLAEACADDEKFAAELAAAWELAARGGRGVHNVVTGTTNSTVLQLGAITGPVVMGSEPQPEAAPKPAPERRGWFQRGNG